jgi:hypothetical protein
MQTVDTKHNNNREIVNIVKSFKKHLPNVTMYHEMKELQTTAILGTELQTTAILGTELQTTAIDRKILQ